MKKCLLDKRISSYSLITSYAGTSRPGKPLLCKTFPISLHSSTHMNSCTHTVWCGHTHTHTHTLSFSLAPSLPVTLSLSLSVCLPYSFCMSDCALRTRDNRRHQSWPCRRDNGPGPSTPAQTLLLIGRRVGRTRLPLTDRRPQTKAQCGDGR